MKCAKAHQALPGSKRVHFTHMQAHWCILSLHWHAQLCQGSFSACLFSTSQGSEANKGWEAAAL